MNSDEHTARNTGTRPAGTTALVRTLLRYTAFLDLALGVASPILGLVASGAGIRAVFLFSALTVLCSAAMALGVADGPEAACPSRSPT